MGASARVVIDAISLVRFGLFELLLEHRPFAKSVCVFNLLAYLDAEGCKFCPDIVSFLQFALLAVDLPDKCGLIGVVICFGVIHV